MAKPIELATQRDFTGGLCLRADQFQLADNESPDMLNMDVDPRGGVRQRAGISFWRLPPAVPAKFTQWRSETEERIWIADDAGDAWLSIPAGGYVKVCDTSTAYTSAVQFRWTLLMQNGVDAPRRWDGTTTGNLTQSWAEDFAAPGFNNMPIAKRMAVHHGHLWLADTLESGTRHPDRLRFSHPNAAEAWRSLDWIDLDPGLNNEAIVELIPYQDHLLAFKANSVYAIFGFGWDSWSKQNVTRDVGCVTPGAAVATPNGVYFFDWPNGIMHWDGKNLNWAFSRLAPALRDGTIPAHRRDEIRVGWADNRLWVSVPWGDDDHRILVLDPSIGKEGSWVMYKMPVSQVMEYETTAGTVFAGASRNGTALYEIVRPDQYSDELVGGEYFPIESHYRTKWFDAGLDAMRKRWRRLWVTYWGDGEGLIDTDLYVDYDNAQRRKSWTEAVLNQVSNPQWDSGVLYDSGALWGQEGTHHEIERGVSLGNAHSVQLHFKGPANGAAWGIDSLTLPYMRRRVR